MGTKNRRVAAYLPPEVDKAFIQFKIDRGLATARQSNQNDSQALIQLLSEFLGVGQSVAYSAESDIILRLEQLERKVTHLVDRIDHNQDIAESIRDELRSKESTAAPGQMSLLHTLQGSDEQRSFIPPPEPLPQNLLEGLTGAALSKRLGVDRGTVRKHRNMDYQHFLEWSQDKDPDGIPWQYDGSKYYPVTSS